VSACAIKGGTQRGREGSAQGGGDRDEGARADEVGGERRDPGTESAVDRRPKATRHDQHLVGRLQPLGHDVLEVRARRHQLVRDGLGRRVGGLPAVRAVRPGARGAIRAGQ